MRCLKRKDNTSALDKTPENTAAAETAVVPVNPEVVMDMVEDKVISHSDHDNNTINAKKELKDDVVVPTDGVNVFKQSTSEEEMNKGIVTEGGEAGDGDDDAYLASGVDDISASDDEDGGEGNDEHGGQDEESDDEDHDHIHDQNELENENQEEDNELENGNHEEDNVEDVKPENDEGGQVNTGKEEVKEDNRKKLGLKSQRGRLRKKVSASVDMNGEKKNAGGASGQADIITEHKGGQSDAEAGIKSQRGRLRKKVSASVDMNGEKKNAGRASGQADTITEHKGGQSDAGVIIGEADGGKAKEMIEKVGGESSNQKLNKMRKDSRVKTAEGGPMKVATEREDKRKLLPKKKSSKKVKTMGMIFMCNTKTKDDCFRYQVLGLPASKRETAETIYKGMRLFLYDVDLKLLYGVYKAAAPGGYNIQPNAFNSQFPSQVRYTVLDDCEPLAEEKFKRVLKDNYYTKKKFKTLLTSNQVKDLCKLFASSKQRGPRKLDGSRRRKAPVLSNRDEVRPRRYQPYFPAYERAVIAPPVHVASHHRPPLPPRPVADIPYDYDRAVGIDGYRREALVEHHDSYRRPLLKHRDSNRRAPLLEHHDVYRRQPPLLDHDDSYRQDVVRRHELLRPVDEYRRPDPLISYRGVRYSGGEVGMLDPYRSYRKSADGLLAEDDVMAEYRSVRPRYGYY